MMQRFLVLCLGFASSALVATGAVAQEHFPVSAEATVGFRVGHGGSYDSRSGAALDLALAYRLRDTSVGTLVTGVALGIQTPPLATDLDCLMLQNGGCAPNFPGLVSVAALAGVQRGSARTASARLLVEPTYHQPWEGRGGLGLQGRVDVSTPPWQHTAVVASLRHSLLPRFRGEAVEITSFGLGLRIQ
jgi:hypothetical protein